MGIKNKMKSGEVVSGLWVQSGCPVATEIMAQSALDFVVLDMEHGEAGDDRLAVFLRALESRPARGKSVGFVRVRENDTITIRRALDAGAEGIIVPLVNTAQQAEKAVAACRFLPTGSRGYAFCRANHWGGDFESYIERFDREVVLIAMIESREAVENIDEILAVDGVDGVLIGPYDLSGSYQVPGEINHPMVQQAKKEVLLACAGAGKAAGQHIVQPTQAEVSGALAEGYRFLALGMDTVFIAEGTRKICEYLEAEP